MIGALAQVPAGDDIDNPVDDQIAACLDLANPKSLFLFAGAGSGKTRSLVSALKNIQRTGCAQLRLKGQRVAVITYTNAACDEIRRRIEFDPTIDVSTIHSFVWSLISGLNRDIREYLRTALADDIAELKRLEAKGRKGTQASLTRISQIASKTKRLENLDTVRKFIYSPTGDNRGRDSLSHSEVIKIAASLLESKHVMQSILVGRYPFLLIDESQDTNKHLIDALFAVQATHRATFALALFGDMMQRIYSDGKDGLGQALPDDWEKPVKRLNHRCPKRVIKLINKVRMTTDGQQQIPRSDSIDGHVRLFILPSDTADKPATERAIAAHMAKVAGDEKWMERSTYKILLLEHKMSARRMGFLDLFGPLYDIDSFKTSLLDGTLPAVRFFSEQVLPLVRAQQRGDRFYVTRVVRQYSPLLSKIALAAAADQPAQLKTAVSAIDRLMTLWRDGADPTLQSVLLNIAGTKLFVIPESLQPAVDREGVAAPVAALADPEEMDFQTLRAEAIDKFLSSPFSQVERYADYVAGNSPFDTHQGVKGLEFERVMVVMDDAEARGFLFKYEYLFGGKADGEKSTEAVRRLFYVTCSRAQRSLALIAYAETPARVKQHVLQEGWFENDEVHVGLPE